MSCVFLIMIFFFFEGRGCGAEMGGELPDGMRNDCRAAGTPGGTCFVQLSGMKEFAGSRECSAKAGKKAIAMQVRAATAVLMPENGQ